MLKELYKLVGDRALLEYVHHAKEATRKKYDIELAECMEWLARFAMGIKCLTINAGYNEESLWDEIGYFIEEDDSGGTLEEVWEKFKETAKEGVL